MESLFKTKTCTVLILVIFLHLALFRKVNGEFMQSIFKVTDDVEALSHSVKIAEWGVGSKLECHVKCGREKGCVTVEFEYDPGICTAYSESTTETGLQRTPGSIVTNKVRN